MHDQPEQERSRGQILSPDAAERISAGCYGALIAAATLIGLGSTTLDRSAAALATVVLLSSGVAGHTVEEPTTPLCRSVDDRE